MARIDHPVGYRVDLIEYERGWGSKIDETLYFDNEAEARQYCKDFNAKNTAKEWACNWLSIQRVAKQEGEKQ